jgi:hypothetical protein
VLIASAHNLLPTSRIVVVGRLDPQGGPALQDPGITYLRKPFRIAEFALAVGRKDERAPSGPA